MMGPMQRAVLRERTQDQAPPVTSVELFFDLVYVFAVTQLSQHLLHDLTLRGAVETLVLFLAVWWAWNYTAWATNWIDPDLPAVRVLMLALMLISLVMSAKIPRAFGDEAVGFAAAYVAIQVVRSGFMVVAFRGQSMGRNYAQLLAWSCIAGAVWIAGAFLHGDARLLTWILALALDYGAPLHGFALPGLGAHADARVDAGRRPSRRAQPARRPDRARRVDPGARQDVQRAPRRRVGGDGVRRRLRPDRLALVGLLRPLRGGGGPRDLPLRRSHASGARGLRVRARDHGRGRDRRRGCDRANHGRARRRDVHGDGRGDPRRTCPLSRGQRAVQLRAHRGGARLPSRRHRAARCARPAGCGGGAARAQHRRDARPARARARHRHARFPGPSAGARPSHGRRRGPPLRGGSPQSRGDRRAQGGERVGQGRQPLGEDLQRRRRQRHRRRLAPRARHNGDRFDLYENVVAEEPAHLDERARGRVLGVDVLVPDRAHRSHPAHVDEEVVELDDVAPRDVRRRERRCQVLEDPAYLAVEVPLADQLTLRVERNLP